MTITATAVTPEILLRAALFEKATCVDVQGLAMQVALAADHVLLLLATPLQVIGFVPEIE